MEDIMLIRSSFLRHIISQVINKILKKQLPGTEVQLGEVQANWSEKEQMRCTDISATLTDMQILTKSSLPLNAVAAMLILGFLHLTGTV